MPSQNDLQNLRNELENIIDRVGLSRILQALSEVAGEKADHVRTNWQDEALARLWDRACAILDTAANRPAIRDIP